MWREEAPVWFQGCGNQLFIHLHNIQMKANKPNDGISYFLSCWYFQVNNKEAVTQEVSSKVLEAKVLEEWSEHRKENRAGVAENSGSTSSMLVPTLRQTSHVHRKVFHSHLQISCRCFKKWIQRRVDRLWGRLHQGSREERTFYKV